jgi:hypothetical protein
VGTNQFKIQKLLGNGEQRRKTNNNSLLVCQASNEEFVVRTLVLRKLRTKVLTTNLLTPQFKADRRLLPTP